MMKVRIVELQCSDCHMPWHPELVVQGDDGHFYLLGKCANCNEKRAANIETLYCELYSAKYGTH